MLVNYIRKFFFKKSTEASGGAWWALSFALMPASKVADSWPTFSSALSYSFLAGGVGKITFTCYDSKLKSCIFFSEPNQRWLSSSASSYHGLQIWITSSYNSPPPPTSRPHSEHILLRWSISTSTSSDWALEGVAGVSEQIQPIQGTLAFARPFASFGNGKDIDIYKIT